MLGMRRTMKKRNQSQSVHHKRLLLGAVVGQPVRALRRPKKFLRHPDR
jgi:hypothetical protein